MPLTRSFWFLFPVANYGIFGIAEAEKEEAEEKLAASCFGCDKPFPAVSRRQATEWTGMCTDASWPMWEPAQGSIRLTTPSARPADTG